MARQAPLFSELDHWRRNPLAAFDAFLRSPAWLAHSRRGTAAAATKKRPPRLTNRASIATYTQLFRTLLAWLAQRPAGRRDLFALAPADLRAFLEQHDADGRPIRIGATVRRQYLAIVERIYLQCGIEPNPARTLCHHIARREPALGGRDAATAALAPADLQRLFAVLAAPPSGDARSPWKEWRDKALVAVLAGGGLRVAEAIALKTDAVGAMELDGTLGLDLPPCQPAVPASARRVVLAPPAAQIVDAWRGERQRLPIAGEHLFPATVSGKAMERTRPHRIVAAALGEAGIRARHRGGRTLRNSFAVARLMEDAAPEAVRQALGLHEARSVARYAAAAERKRRQARR